MLVLAGRVICPAAAVEVKQGNDKSSKLCKRDGEPNAARTQRRLWQKVNAHHYENQRAKEGDYRGNLPVANCRKETAGKNIDPHEQETISKEAKSGGGNGDHFLLLAEQVHKKAVA